MYTKSCKGKCCYRYLTLSLIQCHFTVTVLVFLKNEIAVILFYVAIKIWSVILVFITLLNVTVINAA
jgi:hypothetical protein